MPTVSVIMPAFNSSDFIGEAIESVLSQSFSDWELLIVDDCSLDETRDIVSNYLYDSRVKLYKNSTNSGGAAARNRAIDMAQGRYIAFLDSDDVWESNKLSTQIHFMIANDISFSFTKYININESGAYLSTVDVPIRVNLNNLVKNCYIGCLTVIYDSRKLGKVHMPDIRKRHDFALWLTLLKKTSYAYGLNEKLGRYRIREGSLSGNKREALKYYWHVLRCVGGLTVLKSAYSIVCYLFIVTLKKRFPRIYRILVLGLIDLINA